VAARLQVRIQEADFSVAELQESLRAGDAVEGAIATFTGYVRVDNASRSVTSMLLEHYPGMTETSIETILAEAAERWPLLASTVMHRVGELHPGDQIVWVGVSSVHREASFAACEFIMDYLKTRAPFWKKEMGPEGAAWVDARCSDNSRAERWNNN